jgi:hypothetical protein
MDRRHVCGQSKEYLHANVSTVISEEISNARLPHGPGRALVPGGLRLVKNTYLTKARMVIASVT